MKTLKKIYYVPGMISAILIPLVFWYYGSQSIHKPFTVVDLGIPAKSKKNGYDNTFQPYRNWNYQKITVKPNTVVKNQKFYISELKKLQARNEKETGIEFVINDKNTLQDIVSLIDVMTLAKQEYYGIDLDKTGNFFAVHFYKGPSKNEDYDDTVYLVKTINDNLIDSYPLKGYLKFEFQLSQLPKQTFYIIFAFLIFLNISMFSIKDSFQIH